MRPSVEPGIPSAGTRPLNPHPPATPSPHSGSAGTLQSLALLNGQRSVLIEHQGLIYRLQETKLGKLILTK